MFPSNDEIVLSDRVKFLEIENLKLNEIIKNFTRSQSSLDHMIGGLVANSSKHGLGYQNNKQKRKPRKHHPLLKLLTTTLAFTMMTIFILQIQKLTCHYCCLKGHVSIDCLARFFPTNLHGGLSNILTLLEPESGYQLMHLLQVHHLAPKLDDLELEAFA